MNLLTNSLVIFVGGGIGSILRYLTYQIITPIKPSAKFLNYSQFNKFTLFQINWLQFPWATFLVNIFGSLLAGIIYFFIIKNFDNFSDLWKNFLTIGLLGGFTTFSAFSLDFFRLFSANQISLALIYAISSLVIALIAVFFGFHLAKFLFS